MNKSMSLNKITAARVKKSIKEDGIWKGYFTPSNTYPNLGHPFNMAMYFEITDLDELEKTRNSFEHYNCDNERGYRIHFYEVVTNK